LALPVLNIEKVRFLVVEDNRYMRTIIYQILRALGARHVVEADDGASAFKMLKTANADIIFTALMMAPLDGIEFTRMVRTASDSPNPYVPIIMVTAYTEAERVHQARDAGITEFVAKPISVTSLYIRIAEVIERPREFVRTQTYFGPDRHRHDSSKHVGPERRGVAGDDGADEETPDGAAAPELDQAAAAGETTDPA
jgi:CheY-like chemotaxis protein